MDVWVYIKPGLNPDDRWAIEDAIEEALGDRGEVTGGGTMLDGSESDFSVEIFDDATPVPFVLEQFRAVLRGFEFTEPADIRIRIGEQTFGLWDA